MELLHFAGVRWVSRTITSVLSSTISSPAVFERHKMTSMPLEPSASFLNHLHCAVCHVSFLSASSNASISNGIAGGNEQPFWIGEVSGRATALREGSIDLADIFVLVPLALHIVHTNLSVSTSSATNTSAVSLSSLSSHPAMHSTNRPGSSRSFDAIHSSVGIGSRCASRPNSRLLPKMFQCCRLSSTATRQRELLPTGLQS